MSIKFCDMKLSDSAPESNKHWSIIYALSFTITFPVLCIGGMSRRLGINACNMCNELISIFLPGSHIAVGNLAAARFPNPQADEPCTGPSKSSFVC